MGFITGALAIVPLVLRGVEVTERLLGGLKKGSDKEDAAVSVVSTLAPMVSGDLRSSIWLDPDVLSALRDLIRAVVTFLNRVRDAQARATS